MNTQPLLNPKTVAVVGASRDRDKLGNIVFRNCTELGFRGKVYPVNPTAKRIEGKRAYPSLSSLPVRPDLVIVVTPAPTVPAILRDAVKAKARVAVVISAGFKEIGERGVVLERQIFNIAKRGKLTLIGPNCLGIVLPHLKLNASFGSGMPEVGQVSVLSQSGAIAVAEMDWASSRHIGFRAILSLGNKTTFTEIDGLQLLAKDPGTKIILMYLEDIREGRKFLQVAQRITPKKPIIILRAGRSVAAAKAAQSHTGAIAGSSAVTDTLLRQAGCVVVEDTEDWFTMVSAFMQKWQPRGNRTAIITNAGGPGILATDALARSALQLAQFSTATFKKLQKVLPASASLHNPLDITGDAPPLRYRTALEIVLQDKAVDIVIAVLTHQYVTQSAQVAKLMVQLQHRYRKPIFASFIGGKKIQQAVNILRAGEIPVFPFPEIAVRAAEAVCASKSKVSFPIRFVKNPAIKKGDETRVAVGMEAQKMFIRAGIRDLKLLYEVKSVGQAVSQAKKIGYPVVLKVDAPSIIHKTERGAVALDLHTPAMVRSTFSKMSRVFHRDLKAPNANIVVQKQKFGGLEIFLGGVRDPQFGPVLAFGLGGIFVEALHRVDYIAAPVTYAEARKFIEQSKLWPILKGARGRTFDLVSLAKLISQLGQYIAKHPELESVDCNPAVINHDSISVLDIRIVTK
jgi:acetate---CoA ligase (ADP-forming)